METSSRHEGSSQRENPALTFLRQLIDGRSQYTSTFRSDFPAPILNQNFVAITHGMRDNHYRQAHKPRTLTCNLGKRGKFRADYGDSGDTKILELDRVTRGPGG